MNGETMKILGALLMIQLFFGSVGWSKDNEIEAVLIHPIYDQYYACAEHWAGQLKEVGDALGTDCLIQKLEKRNDGIWLRSYATDGLTNKDWYGWQKNVLSPFNGKVIRTNLNSTVNQPGILGKGMASFVILERDDGVRIMLGHVDKLKVKVGDSVKAGQVIAKVGNNGQSRHPHIHIGAWRGAEPMQIRFDQKKMRGLE